MSYDDGIGHSINSRIQASMMASINIDGQLNRRKRAEGIVSVYDQLRLCESSLSVSKLQKTDRIQADYL